MIPSRIASIPLLLLAITALPGAVATRQASRGSTPQRLALQEVPAVLAAARQSLAGGRLEEAISGADRVLAGYPANRNAAQIKISALLDQRNFAEALTSYDAYAAALRKPDATVLGVIARAELWRIVQRQPNDPISTADALERLARAGDERALQALKTSAASSAPISSETLAPLVSLGRLGDAEAAAKLGELLRAARSWQDKTAVIRALQDAGARGQAPAILARLDDPEPQVQGAAALALGALQDHDAVPKLTATFNDGLPVVRLYAAVALKRLGQTSADAFLSRVLNSDVPQNRLTAAAAYQSAQSTQWIPRVRELLGDRNELARLQAAEVLAPRDAAVARTALVSALNSPNPLLRAEAARILEATNLLDVKLARRLLGDPFETARLYAAGAALRAAAPRRP